MNQYELEYPGTIEGSQLQAEIRASSITVALDSVSQFGSTVSCAFKAALSEPEQTLLASLVAAHDPQPTPTPVMEVITQYEKNDKSLKLCSNAEDCNSTTGEAVLLIKVPGTPGSSDSRYVAGGMAWFEHPEALDRVKVYITDEDNILGYGAGTVVGSYTDDDAAEGKRGWYVPIKYGHIEVEAIGGYGVVPAGLYLKIVGIKQTPATGGKFFCNLQWGKGDGSL